MDTGFGQGIFANRCKKSLGLGMGCRAGGHTLHTAHAAFRMNHDLFHITSFDDGFLFYRL
jgi:hypothetical protein